MQQVGNSLLVDSGFCGFVQSELLRGLPLPPATFWQLLESTLERFVDRNQALIALREDLQLKIDAYHVLHRNAASVADDDNTHYMAFLKSIGYIEPPVEPFTITTHQSGLDTEIDTVCGPQIVVPVTRARFALNAANSRWGSLYDVLCATPCQWCPVQMNADAELRYGTDATESPFFGSSPPPPIPTSGFSEARALHVISVAKSLLDKYTPLTLGSHTAVSAYTVADGQLQPPLLDPQAFIGYNGHCDSPTALLLQHNHLHIIVRIDRSNRFGKTDAAGVSDIMVESSITSIMDFEDSVACVDAADKVEAYRVWLGLMKGDLTSEFEKAGGMIKRGLVPDMSFTRADGSGSVSVRARALMLTRNVGIHMYTDMVTLNGKFVPENIVDSVVTIVAAMHDLLAYSLHVNSPKRCVYLVKPKLHSSAEVQHVVAMTEHIEGELQLRPGTVKLMLMDEERRFSTNLMNCFSAAKDRIYSTNTGFLDRTGNEFRCSCEAGPMLPKQGQRTSAWIKAYEQRNVLLSAAAGLLSVAQVGKGMWAKPDSMADMMTLKSGHVISGASNAWVPSPTAATLHALHYHDISVRQRQQLVMQQLQQISSIHDYLLKELLTIPIVTGSPLTPEQVTDELRGNIQSILGYTVHWVHSGVGCSKVPDISGENLMEDRATLRIAVQLVHNWLVHAVTTRSRVQDILMEMAATVDLQNKSNPDYIPLLSPPGLPPSLALVAAAELIDTGGLAPQGYTEPVLHKYRLLVKQRGASKL